METQVEATKAWQATVDRRHRIPDQEKRSWEAERIGGELLKLGVQVGRSTIQKYIYEVRKLGTRRQTWATFLRNHASEIWACDFLQGYDLFFRPLFVFVVIELGS